MRHLLIKTDTEFTPTASMSISQASKNLGDLVFIKIILIIKGDTMCAQSWLPTQAEEMMISTITGEKPGLEARRRQRGTCDHQSIIEHEHRVKTGPGLLYPGLIRCSSGDWGIMMERPGMAVSHNPDQRSATTSVKSDKTYRTISNLWQSFKWSRENLLLDF